MNISRHATLDAPDWTGVSTVLLDMDGTLLDLRFDNYFWRELLPEHYAHTHGIGVDEARAELAPRFAAKLGTLEWYCTDHWTRELKLDVVALKRQVREHIRFLPDAQLFLTRVRAAGKRLLLVTNAHHDTLHVKAEWTGLATYFDAVVSSHSYGFPKEHPQFWRELEAAQQVPKQRALFVDDSLPVLRAAREYGIAQMFAISRPDSTLPASDIEGFPAVESVAELLGTLDR